MFCQEIFSWKFYDTSRSMADIFLSDATRGLDEYTIAVIYKFITFIKTKT